MGSPRSRRREREETPPFLRGYPSSSGQCNLVPGRDLPRITRVISSLGAELKCYSLFYIKKALYESIGITRAIQNRCRRPGLCETGMVPFWSLVRLIPFGVCKKLDRRFEM